ncbi:hypothetical protein ABL78_0940 [Leptomonas seymouri]|uniref:Uncharacterized protein n=1 Tax=Leptomonas seymouri TaxID=5684 RepID=A0A0N1IBC4_LEPSE|nr:hypothetical protein ABL78_0940 [Leptomonas seymouri]|eukprot:KPI89972.1 hypothetical protein ABL78_0940 [Leptomonas seymouri]
MAADYLVTTFADMMHSSRFRKHVWSRMLLAERRRLESLRLQALYGDAPDHSNSSSSTSVPAKVDKDRQDGKAAAAEVAEKKGVDDGKAALTAPPSLSSPSTTSAKMPLRTQPTPSPPRWFDIAGRARYNAWVALRGRMTPDIAAECFCAEFLGLMRKYPHAVLLPPVEAALRTAHGLAQRARNSGPRIPRLPHSDAASSPSTTAPLFQVRALQGDPAALALLWICRAYRITCEFIVEPLSRAMGRRRSAPTATAAASADPYLPYTMADACYPFSASLTYPNTVSTTEASGSKAAATVTTPESAFVLIADTFLSAFPHWMGVPSNLPSSSPAPIQRCGWIDELQCIIRHVRTPILALLVHYATQPSSAPSNMPSQPSGRAQLLRAVAAHLHRYESWTMERLVSRRVGHVRSVLSPLLASTAVVNALQNAYAPDAKAVTAADVLLASCGYVLCTHPFCADVFPMLHIPVNDAESEGVRSRWPSSGKAATTAIRSENVSTHVPWALPLYLSGLPAEYNEKINRLLRRETKGAMQHEQQQQPIRLFIDDSNPVAMKDVGATSSQQQRQQSAGYYEVSSASVTKEAAEAVGELLAARLLSLRDHNLQRDDVVGGGSISSGGSAPFLVLGHVFSLTWALAQEQVPAFPYFMLDGNPAHFGGFSFMSEDGMEGGKGSGNAHSKSESGGAGAVSSAPRARRHFQVSLAPAAAASTNDPIPLMLPTLVQGSASAPSASSLDDGLSIESRLRSGLHLAGAALLKGVRRISGSSKDEYTQTGHHSGVHATRVLRSEGEGSNSSGVATPPAAEVRPAHL